MSEENYIVVKTTKSEGLAVLLVFLFGPIGLFYSTIRGAIIMTFVVPFVAFLLVLLYVYGISQTNGENGHYVVYAGSLLVTIILFLISYWVICVVWAYNAVKNYNEEIFYEQKVASIRKQNNLPKKELNRQELFQQLEQISGLKEKGVLTEEQFEIEKAKILAGLGHTSDTGVENKAINEGIIKPKISAPLPNESESSSNNSVGIIIMLGVLFAVCAFCVWYNYSNNGEKADEKITTTDISNEENRVDQNENVDNKNIFDYFPASLSTHNYKTLVGIGYFEEEANFRKELKNGEDIYIEESKWTGISDSSTDSSFEINKLYSYKIKDNSVYLLSDRTIGTGNVGNWIGEECILKLPPARWQENSKNKEGIVYYSSAFGKIDTGYSLYEDCIVVTTNCPKADKELYEAEFVSKFYYAKEVGLVKVENYVNGVLDKTLSYKTLTNDSYGD